MARICWHAGRLAEVSKLEAAGYRGRDLRDELSRLWGVPVSPASIESARRRVVESARRRVVLSAKSASPLVTDTVEQTTPSRESCDLDCPDPQDADTGEWEPISLGQESSLGQEKRSDDRYLLISDLQIPFEHQNALSFCVAVQREYGIPKENVICVGDETDEYFGSMFSKDPNAAHTPLSELAESLDRLRRWYSAFPLMRVCNSNHGDRWLKKATEAQIPSQLLRAYREVIQAPQGWRWADRWQIDTKHPFDVEHGHHGAQGVHAHRAKAIDNGRSVAHGHLHASAGISYVRNSAGRQVWGMNVGSMVDVEAYAFHYARAARFKPWIGVGVVVGNGSTPILVPYGSL